MLRNPSIAPSLRLKQRRRKQGLLRMKLVLAVSVVIFFFALYVGGPVRSKNVIVVQAEGRGKGLLNPRNGREITTEYTGDTTLSEALRSGSAKPLALATADFDLDGAPDLISGYRYFSGGILTIQRGNVDAFAPRDLKFYDRAAQGLLPPSFLPAVQTISIPEPPDFLLVGDFDADGKKDLITAARGGGLYLLAGDGKGGFEAPEQLALPGPLTALTAGAFSHAEGLQAVIVGVIGPNGPELVMFDQSDSGLSRTFTTVPLPAKAEALVLGSLDDDPYSDLGIATSHSIIIVHGQKPSTSISDSQRIDLKNRFEQIDVSFGLRELVAGNFTADALRSELVALSDDGVLHLLQRETLANQSVLPDVPLDPSLPTYLRRLEIRKRVLAELEASAKRPMWQPGDRQEWTTHELNAPAIPGGADGVAKLFKTSVSARDTDDLVLLDASNQQVHILIDDGFGRAQPSTNHAIPSRADVSFGTDSAPLAVLAMPQKINGERDLIMFAANHSSGIAVPLAVILTLTVNNTTDQVRNPASLNTNCSGGLTDCSLREAVLKANLANTTGFTNSVLINVPAGTYNLSVNNPSNSSTGTIALPDLEVGSNTNRDTTLLGTGGTPLIHQTVANNDVITTGFLTDLATPVAVTLVLNNLEVTGGQFTGIFTGVSNASGDANTTITGCNIHNNSNLSASVTSAQGGAIFNQCGSLTITNTTLSTNNTADVNAGQGGALFYNIVNSSTPCNTGTLTITGSTFSSNTATIKSGFPAGGAAHIALNGTASSSISTTTFSGNLANGGSAATGGGDGGALSFANSAGTSSVTTSTFLNNSCNDTGGADGHGGAIHGQAGTLNVTFCRFIGNTSATPANGNTLSQAGGTFTGNNNWWGVNTGPPANSTFGTITLTAVLQNRNVISGSNVHNTNQIAPGSSAVFRADIFGLSTGGATSASNLTGLATFPSPVAAVYSNSSLTLGSLTLTNSQYVSGLAANSTTFNSNGTKGTATINSIADSQTTPATVVIGFDPEFVNPGGNDADPFGSGVPCGGNTPCFATIGAALTDVALGGTIHIQAGTYAESPNFNQTAIDSIDGAVNISGSVTLTNDTINLNGNTLSITGDFTKNGGTFNGGTGTLTFNGSGAQAINGTATSETFNNFVVNKSGGTLTVGGSTTSLTVNNVTLTAGTFAAGTAATINVSGNWANNGGTFTPSTGLVNFNNTSAAQSISGSATTQTFNNITVAKTAQTLSVAASTTTLNLNTLTLTSGTFSAGTATNINVGGDWTNNGATFTPGSGTVTFNGGAAQNLNGTAATQTFNNFAVNKGGGTLTGAGSTTTLTLGGAMTLTAGTFKAGTLTGITLNTGDWNNNGGTFTPDSSVVSFTNTGAGQNIAGSAASQTFNGITVAKTAQILAVGGSTTTLSLNGTMTLTSGTFSAGTATAINVGGNWTNNGGSFTPGSGTVTFNSTTAAQSINGSAVTQTFNNLTENKTGQTLSVAASTTTLNVNDLTITAGIFAAGTATNINVAGNWSSTGTFSAASGTVTLNGNNNSQTISGTNTYNNLTSNHTGTGSVSAAGSNLTVLGLLRVQSGMFTSSSSYNNVQIDSGTTFAGDGSTMTVTGNWTNNGGTFTPTGSLVKFTSGGAQAINGSATSQSFSSIEVAKTGGSTLSVAGSTATLTLSSGLTLTTGNFDKGTALTINIGGNWTNNSASTAFVTSGAGTVIFNNAAGAQAIGGTSSTTFNNLTVNNSPSGTPNTINMNNDNTVSGTLALTTADITVAATKTLIQPNSAGSSGTFDVNGRLQRTGVDTAALGTTFNFGNPNNQITVTAGTRPANIVVDLTRSVPTGASGFPTAVQRTYTITPSAGGFTGTLRLHYLDTELNSNTEGSLILRRFNGTGWAPVTPTSFDTTANWVQATGITTFSPWTLSSCCSPTATNGTVSGSIRAVDGTPVAGAVIKLSGAQARKTITDANGDYRFDDLALDQFYTVTPSRANFNFSPFNRSLTLVGSSANAIFTGTSTGDYANPVDTAEYFVRQQYLDVLGREPDEAGFNYWSDQILNCGDDAHCISSQRIAVAASFFIEREYQDTGAFLYDLYAGTLNRKPNYNEYSADQRLVVGGADLEANKAAFAQAFVQRGEFLAKYDSLLNAEAFVDALIASVRSAGVDVSTDRATLLNAYGGGASAIESRAAVVKLLADNGSLKQANYNAAFVLTEYFGYLRRDPDPGGYDFWMNVISSREAGNYRGMVCAFVTSTEYQQRFSRIVNRSNTDCGQ